MGAIIISPPSPSSCELSHSFSSRYLTGGRHMSGLVIYCSLVAPDRHLGG